jgi:YbbR domain-containing protein
VTRLLGFVVHNWPLKVAAVVLASLLYGVLVLARDAQQIPVQIPIEARGQPEDAFLLSQLGQVTRVRYIAPPDVTVNSLSFNAWVDLSNVPLGDGTRTVEVQVEPIDNRIRPLTWEPQQILIRLDSVETRMVPVQVDQGEVPAGLEVQPPDVVPQSVQIRGPASVVARVDRVIGSITIDPAGIDIDRQVELVPVDSVGVAVQQVEVEPSTVRIRVAVTREGETRSLPVHPLTTGLPAPGFELAGISVSPLAVTVGGDGEQLAALSRIDTEPIALDGATQTIDRPVDLALPNGIFAVSEEQVRVVVTFRPVSGTRSFTAGLRLDGALSDRSYELSTDEVLAVIGGSVADLDRLEGARLELDVPVGGLPPGRHEVEVTANLPAGLTLVSASPRTVIVTIGEPAAQSPPTSPSPSP